MTVLEFGRNPRWLGGELGITMVLHTWGQNLRSPAHPVDQEAEPLVDLAGIRMEADLARQREQGERRVEGDVLGLHPARHR